LPTSKLLLLASMPRSGSTWMLRLLNELWMCAGAEDYTTLRTQYHLEKYITGGSALVELSPQRFLPIVRLLDQGHSFAVKTHGCPNGQIKGYLSRKLLLTLAQSGRLVTIYMYRDPRDAVLSGFEYGQRSVKIAKPNAFAETFSSIDVGVQWMDNYMRTCWQFWKSNPNTLQIRYEDVLTQYPVVSARIVDYLGLDPQSDSVKTILEKYQPGATPQVGTHFFKGEIGRFRQDMTLEQQQLCAQHFAPYLEEMGYTQG